MPCVRKGIHAGNRVGRVWEGNALGRGGNKLCSMHMVGKGIQVYALGGGGMKCAYGRGGNTGIIMHWVVEGIQVL